MIYLSEFTFPEREDETSFFFSIRRTCYDSFYPFGILSKHRFRRIDFEPVTILNGGNGTGKSTALNVIAEKIGLFRDTPGNRSNFYDDYLALCTQKCAHPLPKESCILTSDDVFDYMLNIRSLNLGIDQKRETLFKEYLENKYAHFQLKSIDDYEKLRKVNQARSKTQSRYVRKELMDNVREYSNGESAYRFFVEKMSENALYLLDEPENSLSAERQIELAEFIENSARFFGCQYILSTHSPFFLAIRGAKIYDLNEDPVDVKRFNELPNVRTFYDFFQKHAHAFE